MTERGDTRLDDRSVGMLADRFWQARLATAPAFASLIGEHAHDARVPDVSLAGEAAWRDTVSGLAADLDTVAVTPEDEVVAGMLRVTLEQELAEVGDGTTAVPSLTVLGCRQMWAPSDLWLLTLPEVTYPEPAHADAVLERYARAGTHLEAVADRFVEALDLGLPPVRRNVERLLGQLDGFLASDPADNPLVGVGGPQGWDGEAAWRDRLTAVVRDEVLPALATFRERVATEQLPRGRDDEHGGLVHVDTSGELYRRSTLVMAGLEVDAEQVHAIGVDYVTGPLAAEWSALGATTLGESDPIALMGRMREEPSLAYESEQAMLDHAAEALARAKSAMGGWFGRLPQADCVVVPAPAHLAGSGAPAWYFQPAPDGSRPGRYFLDNAGATSMLRTEGEATAFHEAIPGHHLQLAIAGELNGVPAFLKHGMQVAYAEGWGLYAERLADEMGLYSSDFDRLGMLTLDAFRANRLVVDTGLHAMGWPRQRAIDWMTRYTPLPPSTIAAEVDRYLAMPGQALAYKLGQLEIQRLRARAEERLGDRFDIRGFHDAVLGQGMLSLQVLADVVDGWVSHQAGS